VRAVNRDVAEAVGDFGDEVLVYACAVKIRAADYARDWGISFTQ